MLNVNKTSDLYIFKKMPFLELLFVEIYKPAIVQSWAPWIFDTLLYFSIPPISLKRCLSCELIRFAVNFTRWFFYFLKRG